MSLSEENPFCQGGGDLERALTYALSNNVIKTIEITTNGTIVPDLKILQLLKNPKVLVRISDYGTLVDKNKIIDIFKKYQIRYELLEVGKWIAPGGTERRFKDESVLRQEYQDCNSSYYCKTLYEDKIFACARAASLYALNYMNTPEYIQIDNGFKIDELKKFWMKDYSEACDYCDVASRHKQYVDPAIQVKEFNMARD